MTLDRTVAAGAAVGYVALVLVLLPASEFARLLLGGAAAFATVLVLARALGPRPVPPASVLAVTVGTAAVLVMPGLPAMGGTVPRAVPIGFVGTQAAALLWVAHRWEATRPSRTSVSLTSALIFSLIGAGVLSAVATIPIALSFLTDPATSGALLLVYPGYVVGLFGAATLYWLLQGIAHRPVGLYLIGALAGFCLYGAVAPVVYLLDGKPVDLRELVVTAALLGVLVGPPVALGIARHPAT